jgi:hypothetical protein
MVKIGTLLFTLGMNVLIPTVMAHDPPSTVKGPSSSEKPTSHPSIITFREGRLTVDVQNVLLELLLEEISRQAIVAIISPEGLGDESVSVQFQDLPLDQGLRQILKDRDTFFFYGAEEKVPASLKAVWVYPPGQGRAVQPVPPEKWASTKEIEGKLTDPNAEARARAIQALVQRKGDNALDELLKALKDKDDHVRTQALWGALSSGVQLPAESLKELALRDRAAEVRFLALQALTAHPQAGEIAKLALKDPNPHVRTKAQEIILQLEETPRSPEPSRPAKDQ